MGQLNIIRVDSLEELLTTGAALGYNRWPRGRRMGVLTVSGGSCDIIADAASAQSLQGARGAPPANLDVVAEAIAGLGHTALSLNGALRALEVNPLWVNGDQVEALDVLVVTQPEGASGTELGT